MTSAATHTAGRFRTSMIGLYMVIMAIALALILFILFPEQINTDNGLAWKETIRIVRIYKPNFTIHADARLLLLVMTMGALGSYVHAATSFVSYVGNRSFVKSWTWWYFLRPFIGMALAVIFYLVIRGGFLSAGAAASDISAYGITAVAGLAGMFSKQATDKLEEVFSNLFQVSGKGGDAARGDKLGVNRPVKEKMIPLSKITSFKISQPEDQTMLDDLLGLYGPGITRLPVLDDTGALRYIVHRSLIKEFVAGWQGSHSPTLADFAQNTDNYALIFEAVAFVSQSAPIGDAKKAMEDIPRCQDVIITTNGRRDEPVIGWLTNVDLGRLTRV